MSEKEKEPTMTETKLESLKADEKKCVDALNELTQRLEMLRQTRFRLLGAIEALEEVCKNGS